MILTFADKSGSSLKKNADLIIKDTISQSQLLEDLLQEAPAILEGYAGFRKILRAIKRGDSLDKAILNNVAYLQLPQEYKINGINGNDTQMFNGSSLVSLVPYSVSNMLTVDALATLLNSSKITDSLSWLKTIITEDLQIQAVGAPSALNSIIIMHKDKIKYGYFYQVDTSFFDASNLNLNHWLHFSFYMGVVPELPFIAIQLVPTEIA